jgi:O-antigen/teichoic acid export membrane protein
MLICLNGLTSIVLARHLASEDYGIVSFAAIITNFLGQFSDFGLTSAVVRKQNLSDDDLYVGYTLILFLGIIIFAASITIAPITKYFINNSDVATVIRLSSLSFIISTFAFLPTCLLTRELNFKKFAIPQVWSTLLSSAVSMTMAISGYKYWSLVFGNLAGTIALIIIINVIKPVRIRIKLNRDTAYDYLKFGGNLFLAGFIVFIVFNADNLMIGTLNGATVLGFYAVAFNWGSMMPSVLYSTVHTVLFPAFSKIHNKEDTTISAYLQVLRYVSFIAVLANVGLFLVADDFLFFVLGRNTDKWMPAVSALKILSIYGIIRAILEPIANVLVAEGQTRLLFRSNLIVSLVELPLLYPAIRYAGIEGVAILVVFSYTLQYFIYFPYMKRRYHLQYITVWESLQPAIIAGIFVIILISTLQLLVENTLVAFISKIFLIASVYILIYGLMTRWHIFFEMRYIIRAGSEKKDGRLSENSALLEAAIMRPSMRTDYQTTQAESRGNIQGQGGDSGPAG